jgi:sugar/nucleoside kinase (ribokinase family)
MVGLAQGGGAAIVVAGHVCLDVIPELAEMPRLRPSGLVVAGPAALSTGGAVANVGLALHRLGVPVRLVGKVGDDALGRVVLDLLAARDERLVEGMIVAPGETTSYSVVFSPPGIDRAFLHCPGANDTFAADDIPLERLEGARVFHFGYPPIMRRLYSDGGTELARLLAAARARGLATSLDVCHPDPVDREPVDWEALLARVLPDVDVFEPSLDELAIMLGVAVPAPHVELLRSLADRVLAMGPAIFALKLGDQGLYLRTSGGARAFGHLCAALRLDPSEWRDREVLAPCFRAARVAGTTGSGDATIAGLLAALLRGDDPVAAATSAVAVGACSVEAPDATGGIRPWSEVAGRIEAGWPRLPLAPGLVDASSWECDAGGTFFRSRSQETS